MIPSFSRAGGLPYLFFQLTVVSLAGGGQGHFGNDLIGRGGGLHILRQLLKAQLAQKGLTLDAYLQFTGYMMRKFLKTEEGENS